MNFRDLVPDHVQALQSYQPGKPVEVLERELGITGAMKLASNENPLGPSPKAVAAARAALATMHVYPDDTYHRLRSALAERLAVPAEAIVLGCGSNEIVHLLAQALCRPGRDEVLTHEYGFISYRIAAAGAQAPLVEAKAKPDLSCDIDALIALISAKTRLIYLGHANNPTGHAVPAAELVKLIEAKPPHAVLCVDEAYFEYASHADPNYRSALPYVLDVPGVVVLRTFSKVHGLAGLRIGYGIMHPELAGYLHRVRRPFNVGSVAETAALAAMDDHEHIQTSVAAAECGVRKLRACAEQIGVRAFPSVTNFVLFDIGSAARADALYDGLLKRGLIVRPMKTWGLPSCVRVSIGTADQTVRAVALLEAVLPGSGDG
jgi:histidinol-phosphate aminotransferase